MTEAILNPGIVAERGQDLEVTLRRALGEATKANAATRIEQWKEGLAKDGCAARHAYDFAASGGRDSG
eukprot:9096806-Alexandrium_andersonii.AAC.1